MTLRVALRHQTHYQFDRPVNLSPHIVRLRPAPHTRSNIVSYSLNISPDQHFINWQQDAFGNWLARLVFPEKTTQLHVDVEVILDMTVINPFDFFLEESAQHFPFKYSKENRRELAPYLEVDESGELLRKWLRPLKKLYRKQKNKTPTNDFLVALIQRLQADINYKVRLEVGIQNCEETLKLTEGSCRDSAWLLVQILRHLGLASRFVSGYLVQLKADEKSLDGPSGPEQDFTDLHAWCEVYLPGAGWVGLDPTSGLFAGEGHIPLACTPRPSSAAPISGATDKCEVSFEFSNEVTRILEDPRVTKPYSDYQWQSINALGEQIEKQLKEQDVRLTQGGEPTFVSIDDMESPQWNDAALGKEKLQLSEALLLKLKNRFAPNGVLHYGQGKWYPGEEIPRWALATFWRSDKKPLWRNPKLLADAHADLGHDNNSAKQFARTLCASLGIKTNMVQAAYEDAWHYLRKEQELPVTIDPYNANLKDDLERKRLAALLQRGLDSISGYVLPLQPKDDHWQSSRWQLRAKRIILIPGDSPMGMRLPLDSIEKPLPTDDPDGVDPFAERAALKQRSNRKNRATESVEPIRTTLCVESRNGRLHIFMPPLPRLEQWIALLRAIEKTAARLNTPIILEGYEPPKDPRLQRLHVTPDPGVIEVNIHPAANWQELRDNTFALYQDARQSRLAAEKFMLDGRHTGTGGGNHITLGSTKPEDSPFLRRPDLLGSLVNFWQHHPSLSYVFSGMFVGPTSQAPRLDEGRDSAAYELNIALQELEKVPADKPWLVDRIMRNLLVDITGNTHRAEFCIDKLYAPGTSTGRLGLLEFRGFEMPPHPQMAMVQALLIRALVLRFWRKPYKKPPVCWGTALHDQWMLPHYIWQDLKDVCRELKDEGIPFELEWLSAFEEFRFPHYGRLQSDGIELELRWAIEPWDVLGEEMSSFGTARYVDSSVERLQVKASGLTDGRYVIACNGRRVPLHNTGTHGEYVAGVRYKAWEPSSALHPTVNVHVPLVFDIIDTWSGRAIAGCRYHVAHPGGLSYDTLPVNAAEAESRRVNRFVKQNHSQGTVLGSQAAHTLRTFTKIDKPSQPLSPPPEEYNHRYPHTLDLRYKNK